jgi:hypothetical protein
MTEPNITTGIAETVKAELREHKTWYTIQAIVRRCQRNPACD